jgi:hypothetical protein
MPEPITVYDNVPDHILNHTHGVQKLYPVLADPITVTADASGWTLGSFAEIIPANTISNAFHVHHVEISNISANDNYELYLYSGTTLISTVAFTKSASGEPNDALDFSSPHIPANGQVQAKLACKGLVARTVDIKLFYHEVS